MRLVGERTCKLRCYMAINAACCAFLLVCDAVQSQNVLVVEYLLVEVAHKVQGVVPEAACVIGVKHCAEHARFPFLVLEQAVYLCLETVERCKSLQIAALVNLEVVCSLHVDAVAGAYAQACISVVCTILFRHELLYIPFACKAVERVCLLRELQFKRSSRLIALLLRGKALFLHRNDNRVVVVLNIHNSILLLFLCIEHSAQQQGR